MDLCMEARAHKYCVIWCMGYIEWVYRVQRMIDCRTCFWLPKVVGLTCVEGKRSERVGRIACFPGYREVWPCRIESGVGVIRICGKCGLNWQSIKHREQYPPSK